MLTNFKQLFTSKNTITVCGIIMLVAFAIGLTFGVITDSLNPFEYIEAGAGFALSIFLFYALRKQNIHLIGAVVPALLVYEFVKYVEMFAQAFTLTHEEIFSYGFAICLLIAVHMVMTFIIIIITFNHFSIYTKYIGQKDFSMNLVVNQLNIFLLVILYCSILVLYHFIGDPFIVQICSIGSLVSDLMLIILINCSELIIANQQLNAVVENNLSKRDRKTVTGVIWYSLTFFAGYFALAMQLIIRDISLKLFFMVIAITLCQLFGLLYYLKRTKPSESGIVKVALRLNVIISIGAICCAVFFFVLMDSEFHAVLQPDAVGTVNELNMDEVESAENSYVYETEDLYLIFPQYDHIEHVVKDRPSSSNKDITFCSGAAFVANYDMAFSHGNIIGDHVENGEYNAGRPISSDVIADYGAFTFYDGAGHISTDGSPMDDLEKAALEGGDGFMQYQIISDYQPIHFITEEFRYFRALTEINGRICIVDSSVPLNLNDFIVKVQKLGVKDALMMDVGFGWNHSWYRNNNGSVVNLFGISIPFSNNWIVFKK